MAIYSLICLLPPLVPTINLAELKSFLKIDDPFEDDLLNILAQAAVQKFETYTGRAIMRQQWQVVYRHHHTNNIALPLIPVTKILKVETKSWINTWSEIGGALWQHEENGVDLQLISSYQRLRITYIAGMATKPEEVPADIKALLFMNIGHLYTHRDTTKSTPPFPTHLYDSFRHSYYVT